MHHYYGDKRRDDCLFKRTHSNTKDYVLVRNLFWDRFISVIKHYELTKTSKIRLKADLEKQN